MVGIDEGDIAILEGDALARLREIPDECVQCVVTSPPFWGLRDYGVDHQIGREPTPDEWCASLVAVFRECRRVLRSDGVMWLEVGDSYASVGGERTYGSYSGNVGTGDAPGARLSAPGIKPKDLVGAPWMLAFALRADGWYLRSDTIWARPNPMPESVTDRPTKAHSYAFLLTKSARYFYDADAIREAATTDRSPTRKAKASGAGHVSLRPAGTPYDGTGETRNARSVWWMATEPTPFAHFATMPTKLAARCIASGSRPGDIILDPFSGAGTTAMVARRLGRTAIGIELNPEYIEITRKRLAKDAPNVTLPGMP